MIKGLNNWVKIGLASIVLMGAFAFTKVDNKTFEIIKNLEIFNNLYQELNNNYVDDLDPSELMSIGIEAMLKSLDPYTRHISEADIESHRIHSEGKYEGFGGRFKKIGDYATIVEVYEESPAQKAGLIPGDQIISIENVNIKGRSVSDVRDIMNGFPASEINLEIKRYGQDAPHNVIVDRKQINIKNVPYYGMVNDQVGYVVLTTFTANAAKNVRGAIAEMKADNPEMKGVILDLRNNGGGLLSEAVRIANIFLPKNQLVVSTRNKIDSRSQEFRTKGESLDEEIPLAVLINENSASASEIVSGVIQDYDRGILVGNRSFGKGLVQVYKPLKYKNQLKLTISKYYVPSGRCIQSVSYNEDGEPIQIEDEARSKFTTRNGRTVLDGGGIAPDLKIEDKLKDPYIKHLNNENVFLFYATQYYLDHQDETLPDDYKWNDLGGFKQFVENYEFKRSFGPEVQLQKLKESLDKTFDDEQAFKSDLRSLDNKIKAENDKLIDRYAQEISESMTKEIVSRYGYRNGVIKNSLQTDAEVKEAVRVLLDTKEYQKILSK